MPILRFMNTVVRPEVFLGCAGVTCTLMKDEERTECYLQNLMQLTAAQNKYSSHFT